MSPVTDHQGPAWDAYMGVRRALHLPEHVRDWTPEQRKQAEQVGRWLLDDAAAHPGGES